MAHGFKKDLKLPLLKFTDDDLWKLYDAIDADGTGWISLKEFADFARKTPYNTEFKHQQMMRQARKPKVVMPKVTKAPRRGRTRSCRRRPNWSSLRNTTSPKPCAGNYTRQETGPGSGGCQDRATGRRAVSKSRSRSNLIRCRIYSSHPKATARRRAGRYWCILHDEARSAGRAPLRSVALEGPPQRCGRQPAAETSFVVVSPQKPMDLPWTEPTARGERRSVDRGALLEGRRPLRREARPPDGHRRRRLGLLGPGAATEYCKRFASIAPVRGALRSVGLRRAPERAPGHEHLGLPRLERRDDARRLH